MGIRGQGREFGAGKGFEPPTFGLQNRKSGFPKALNTDGIFPFQF